MTTLVVTQAPARHTSGMPQLEGIRIHRDTCRRAVRGVLPHQVPDTLLVTGKAATCCKPRTADVQALIEAAQARLEAPALTAAGSISGGQVTITHLAVPADATDGTPLADGWIARWVHGTYVAAKKPQPSGRAQWMMVWRATGEAVPAENLVQVNILGRARRRAERAAR